MIDFKFVVLLALAGVFVSYVVAVMSGDVNKEISRGARWFYYLSIVFLFSVFGIFIGGLVGLPIIISAAIGAVPGIAFCLTKIVKVLDNEVIIIQNTIFTEKLQDGTPMRLFAKGGLTPLLHGEIERGSWKNEIRKVTLSIRNMETSNNTPLDVSVVISFVPDFRFFQEILQLSQSQDLWWDRVSDLVKALVTSAVSDLIKQKTSDEAIGSKQKMSKNLVEQGRFSDDFLFSEEFQFGFKIVNIKFIDINLTDAVIKAHESILKSSAYGVTIDDLLDKAKIDLSKITDLKERQEVFDKYMKYLLAINGKDISYVEINGGDNSDFLRSKVAASKIK